MRHFLSKFDRIKEDFILILEFPTKEAALVRKAAEEAAPNGIYKYTYFTSTRRKFYINCSRNAVKIERVL